MRHFVQHDPAADLLWGYREGQLHFSAIADPALAGDAGLLEAALREAGIELG